ncbi:MAG: hypothetical protein HY290_33770 [Planctomycetia bacterium]|nr:hypothetical protein [Planctomycetia bacterium]
MAIMLSITLFVFGLSLTALCAWMLVRIANRRRKKTGVAFWAKVALAAVLYALSIGPTNWILKRTHAPEPVELTAAAIYCPVILTGNFGPQATPNIFNLYIQFWN